MRVVIYRQPIRLVFHNQFQSFVKTLYSLFWQTVNQVQINGSESGLAGCLHNTAGLFRCLDPVNRFLHFRFKILYPDAHTVEPDVTQYRYGFILDFAGIDLDGIITTVIIMQCKMLTGNLHQLPHLIVIDKCRRPAAPMQLIYLPILVKEFPLHPNLLKQVCKIRSGMRAIVGDNLIAGTVIANPAAERQVKIQRQGSRNQIFVGFPGIAYIMLPVKPVMKLDRGRVGSITRAGLGIPVDEFPVE